MTEILTVLGNALIVAGALVFATAALGVARFRDAYMRVSAVGTPVGWASCSWSRGRCCCNHPSPTW